MDTISLSIKIEKKDIVGFLMYHFYMRFSGMFGLAISLIAIISLVVKWDVWGQPNMLLQRILLILLGLMYTLIQPLTIYFRGLKLSKMKAFKEPVKYEISEKGLLVVQEKQKMEVDWNSIRKIKYRKKSTYIYISNTNFAIIPHDKCDGKEKEMVEFLKSKTKKKNKSSKSGEK